MGSDEAEAPKAEKASSPAPEQNTTHAYPDWPAIQAYYGAGVPLPPSYFNSAVQSGHPPHPYMWAQQPMMPPYGTPYAAIYSHPGIYPHPSVSFGSHSHGIPSSPAPSEPMVATPLSIKSPSNKDSTTKKLKGLDGLAVSIGDGNAGSGGGSQSADCGTEGSSDGSGASTEGGERVMKERSSEDKPFTGNSLGNALELKSSSTGKTKTSAAPTTGVMVLSREGFSSELGVQDERELKRQRRKQSNRESARRSRLRKQAESEELAMKVEALNGENLALRNQLNQLREDSEKLRLQNTALMEKLKNVQLGQSSEMLSNDSETQGSAAPTMSTENLLSRVNNSGSLTLHAHQESEAHENANSGTKLHQLLKSSPRTDAVAAG